MNASKKAALRALIEKRFEDVKRLSKAFDKIAKLMKKLEEKP